MGIIELGSALPPPLLASLADHTALDGGDLREVVRRDLLLIRDLIDHSRPETETALALLRRLKRNRKFAKSPDLEASIPILLEQERGLADQRNQVLALVKSLRSNAALNAPELLDDVKHSSVALDDLLVTWLKSLRDLRWEAMMILADREPREAGFLLDSPVKVWEWAARIEDSI